VPNTTDVIGEYLVMLDDGATLRGYGRVRRFQRSQAGGEE
jgi:Gas vesicle synthesis protein GvpO